MNITDRYEDIAKRSGFSEDVVKRILKATAQSLASSLQKGESATLPGICRLAPNVKYKPDLTTFEYENILRIKATALESLVKQVATEFEFENEDVNPMENMDVSERLKFINDQMNSGEKAFTINSLF